MYSLDVVLNDDMPFCSALDKDGEVATERGQVEFVESTVATMSLICRIQRSFSRVMFAVFGLVLSTYYLTLK